MQCFLSAALDGRDSDITLPYLMRIWQIIGHPSRLASHPPVSSPSRSLAPQSPIVWVARLDGMFGVGNFLPPREEKKKRKGDQEGKEREGKLYYLGIVLRGISLCGPQCFHSAALGGMRQYIFQINLKQITSWQVLKADVHPADRDESCWSAHVSKEFSGMRNEDMFRTGVQEHGGQPSRSPLALFVALT
eukprot:1147631-Pelagomonas_calceolata.AAC.3